MMKTTLACLCYVSFLFGFIKCLEQCSPNPLTWRNAICCRNECSKKWTKLPLLLLSMDGFRAEYLRRDKTPSIQSLIDCGSHAPFIYPSYPSKTFPNHYTIVTGLYPESHGIIDNTMYDPTIEPTIDRYFSRPEPSAKNPQWWHGEPIWNTVIKNGMKAATYFWPGTEAKIQNMSPTYYLNYNASVPFYQRVDQVIKWLLMNDSERPDFLTVYFDEPDHTGHLFGPESPEVTNELVIVDAFINYLMRKIFENGLMHCLNMVLLADHGMQQLKPEFMRFADYVPDSRGMLVYNGPLGRIMLANSSLSVDDVYNRMSCKYNFSRVYKTEEVPKRFHYSRSKSRQGDIIVEMDPGYTFFNNTAWKDEHGDHGFDYKADSMHALFLAYGPKFKQNFTVKPFQNIELYNLFADTLDIPASGTAPNNGTYGRLHEIFVNPPIKPKAQTQQLPFCAFHQKPKKQCGFCSKPIDTSGPCQKPPATLNVTTDPTCSGWCLESLCQAQECDFSLVHRKDINMPVMARFEINKQSVPANQNDYLCTSVASDSGSDDCPNPWQFAPTLKSMNLSMYSLNHFNEAATKIWYGKVPMYQGFRNGAWSWLQNITMEYAQKYNQLIVMNGAIFDYDADGLADSIELIKSRTTNPAVSLPTHYYQLLFRCDNGQWNLNGSCSGTKVALSFILPHRPTPRNCLTQKKYLNLHTGRIRDLEFLTGLQFHVDDDFANNVELRTRINDALW